jgi:hypothetical protein
MQEYVTKTISSLPKEQKLMAAHLQVTELLWYYISILFKTTLFINFTKYSETLQWVIWFKAQILNYKCCYANLGFFSGGGFMLRGVSGFSVFTSRDSDFGSSANEP